MRYWTADQNNMRLPYQLQWFAKDGPGGEKTEEPTAKKLSDARKDGKVAKSRELGFAIDLIVLFLMLKICIASVYSGFRNVFQFVYSRIPEFVTSNAMEISGHSTGSFLRAVIFELVKIMLPFLLVGFAVCFLVNLLQVGWKVTTKPMKPKFDKFNPISGFKRIVSKDSLFELLKSILKKKNLCFLLKLPTPGGLHLLYFSQHFYLLSS